MAYYPFATEKEARYKLVGPDGTVAIFNDPFDPNYVGYVTDMSGLDSAEIRESAQDLTEADGGSHGYFYMARRPIVMNVSVSGHASVAERNLRIDRARRASLALRGDATLSWKPSTRAENLLGNPRAGVDMTAIGGASAGLTMSRVTTGLPAGFATGVQATGSVASTGSRYQAGTTGTTGVGGAPVTPGVSYTASVVSRLNAITTGTVSALRLYIYWFKADGTTSSLTNSLVAAQVSPALTTDYTLTGSAVAPADAAYGFVSPYNLITNPTNATRVDSGFQLTPTAAWQPGYQDGDTAGWYWQGNPHASPSGDYVEMFTTVRRQQRFQESGAWVKELQIPLVSEYATLFSTGLKDLTGSPVACENRGNYVAYPVIEITGVSTQPRVTDAAGGDFRTLNTLVLASGEKVQFDMLNHTGVFTAGARIGQSATRYIDFSLTKWVTLPAAATTNVTYTSGGGTMRVLWRDAWA